MTAYWIATYDELTDPDKVAEYATLAGPAIVRYGIDHAIIPKDLTALNQAAAAYVAVFAGSPLPS